MVWKVSRVTQERVERTFRITDVIVPSPEHLIICEICPSDEFSIIIVDVLVYFRWQLLLQPFQFSRSTSGELLHNSQGDRDLFAMLFVDTGLVPVKASVIGLARTDTRKYSGLLNACTGDLILLWGLIVRVHGLLSVVSGHEQSPRVIA